MIDLHCHSTASDGTFSPSQLIGEAQKIGLSALALTDHDTTAGLNEFISAAQAAHFNAIPGIELSSQNAKGETLHIVGLYIDPSSPTWNTYLATINQWRQDRNIRIIEKLNALGINITLEQVTALTSNGIVGRPHFAQCLVNLGKATSIRAAFSKFLERGKPGYSGRRVFSTQECIDIIHQGGGLAIWAHPFSNTHMSISYFRVCANELHQNGLDGVEAFYPSHTPNQSKMAALIANEIGLLKSGGTDFHGAMFPNLHLGTAYGTFMIDDNVLAPIQAKATGSKGISSPLPLS